MWRDGGMTCFAEMNDSIWKARLIGGVADLEAADPEAGVCQHHSCEHEQAGDGHPGWNGFGLHGQQSEDALSGHANGHEVPQVGGYADLLQHGRHDRVDGLPSHEQHRRGCGIAEDHAQEKKDGSIAEAPERHNQEIGTELSASRAMEDVVLAGCAEADVDQNEVDEDGDAETDLRVRMTLEAFQQIGRFLAGVPGRKNLIWLSGSFPLALFPDPDLKDPY